MKAKGEIEVKGQFDKSQIHLKLRLEKTNKLKSQPIEMKNHLSRMLEDRLEQELSRQG